MRKIFLVAFGVALAACFTRTTGGSGSDGGTAGSDSSGSEAGSDGTNGTDVTTGNTSGPGCGDYLDDPAGSFTFNIQNNRDEAIVLGGPTQCQPSLIAVDSDSDEVPGSWTGPHCAFTCAEAISGGCGCTDDCPTSPPIRLEPGGRYPVEWHGRVLSSLVLPAGCASDDCGQSCNVLREVPEGIVHRVTIGLVDPSACVGGECSCTPNVDGWCEAEGYYDLTDPIQSGFTYAPGGAADIVVG